MIIEAKYLDKNYIETTFENGNSMSCLIDNEELLEWIADGGVVEDEFTDEELLQQIEDAKPKVVTMRQARLALLQGGLLQTVTDAIANGTDEAMKIEWEYATEVKRDWNSLVTLTTALGMTSAELDDLFQLASTL